MNKVDEPFNFILHKTYDVSKIKEHISRYKDEWLINTDRQRDSKHHTKTYTYVIHYMELIDDFTGYQPKIEDNVDKELLNMILPVLQDMEKIYNGKFARVLLVNLPPKSDITPHFDKHEYFNITRRFHLPIMTNDLAMFTVGDETIKMQEGQCWEINNKKVHRVVNDGDTDRTHLIFDIAPITWILRSKP